MDRLFIVAGMPRGGTTFLYHNLNKHPAIYLPSNKEVNFFTVNWSRGTKWYESLYQSRRGQAWCGDISPPCFLDTNSIGRIKEYNPKVKIIFSVRRPSEYAFSFYSQFKTFTYKMPAFEEFLLKGYTYTRLGGPLHVRFMDDYIVRTIMSFMEAFGENILFYRHEILSIGALNVLRAIERFLCIDSYFNDANFDNLRINASNRANIKWLSRILQDEKIVALIQKLFPRDTIVQVRNFFDKVSSSIKMNSNSMSDDDKILAREVLREQDEKVDKLFAGRAVIAS
jgi:hypothetical protein